MAPLLCFAGSKPIYTLVPSLQHLATVKIATVLWNRNDIRRKVNEDSGVKYYDYHGTFHEYDLEVETRELSLPEQNAENLRNAIRLIGEEIYAWKGYHEEMFDELPDDEKLFVTEIQLPTELCWETSGALDYTKAAQALVKDTKVPLDMRFKLACNYCLEDDVMELWKQTREFSQSTGQKNRNKRKGMDDPLCSARADRWLELLPPPVDSCGTLLQLQFMWNIVAEKKASLDNMLCQEDVIRVQSFLTDICRANNIAAIKYLLPHLTENLRKLFLDRISMGSKGLKKKCLVYLLSLMNETQQADFFKNSEDSVKNMLCYCVCWPNQDLLLPTTNYLMPMLSKEDFLYVLMHIVVKTEYDDERLGLFGGFWEASSESHKQYVVEQCVGDVWVIYDLFKGLRNRRRVHGGYIKLIWKQCTAENKKVIMDNVKREIEACVVDYEDTDSKSEWRNLWHLKGILEQEG